MIDRSLAVGTLLLTAICGAIHASSGLDPEPSWRAPAAILVLVLRGSPIERGREHGRIGQDEGLILVRHGFASAAWDPPRRSTDVGRVGTVEPMTGMMLYGVH